MRVIIFTVGVVSHLNQCFRLAECLADHGHEVKIACADGRARAPVEAQGLGFVHLEGEHANRQERGRAPERKLRGLRRVLRWPQRVRVESTFARASLENGEIDDLLQRLQPDLVLADYELHDTIVRVATSRTPLMLLEYHCSPLKRRGLPILSSNRIPTGGIRDDAAIDLRWRATFAKRWLKRQVERVSTLGHDAESTRRELARRRGFDLVGETCRRHWHFLTYPRIPTLYLSPPEFDFPHDPSNPEFRIGPMVALGRREPGADPAWADFVAEWRTSGAGRRLIYCAMGSILSDRAYYRRVIEAVAPHPDWTLVVAAGRSAADGALGSLPPNVRVFSRVPQLEILPRVDLMLHHAGLATIFECIYFGVPMLAYSGGALEENGNAARVEFHGLGLRGSMVADSAAEIGRKIQRVLNEPSYVRAVQRMQQTFRSYHDDAGWVELLERRATLSADELGWVAP